MYKEQVLADAIKLVGEDAYRNDPIVHHALRLILRNTSKEEALALAVKILSERNRSMMKDLVAIAISRPPPFPKRLPACDSAITIWENRRSRRRTVIIESPPESSKDV